MLRTLSLLAVASAAFAAAPSTPSLTFDPPEKSVSRFAVPEGFRVRLVAGEPTLIKPIAMTTDERGRLWVVESHSYPHWITADDKPGKDRVLILERQPDGSFSSKVFLDNGRNLSGIAIGHGGVWLASVPKITFVPRKPGSDVPAGPEVVKLDGFDLKAKHNVVNTLAWGPDGWLYGCNGILSHAKVGKPGIPAKDRVTMDCGIWRYHPARAVFEMVASGTTNPWGIDWNDRGELFLTNCVIKHLFHVVPGAHFQRMFGQDVMSHSYDLMQSCADHIHWGGGNWTSSRGGKGEHSVAGGGHAHAGAMFYLGDTFPKEYRDRVFMCNIHGNRLNSDILLRHGSGYVAKHGDDYMQTPDPWFRGLGLTMSADGGFFVSDWHDTGECHNYDKTHPSGRVYHVNFGSPKVESFDLSTMPDAELVKLQSHKNDWWVRQSRVELAARAAARKLSAETAPALWKLTTTGTDTNLRLRGLWASHVVGAADAKKFTALLADGDEAIRLWAVRLLVDDGKPSAEVIAALEALAAKESSAAVRLALASAMQRVPAGKRLPLATALTSRAEDAKDANLPLMYWYGVEPIVAADPAAGVKLLTTAKVPAVRQYVARRLATMAE